MLQKLSVFPVMAYFAAEKFVKEFKQDERGLSGVVVAVLLILVSVLAVTLIWQFLGDWLKELWETITNTGNSIS